jgi:hypothetical protein
MLESRFGPILALVNRGERVNGGHLRELQAKTKTKAKLKIYLNGQLV